MSDPLDQGLDMLKRGFKFAKRMGGKVVKEGKKAAGIQTGKVSDANPRFYIVVARQGAMVREGIDLSSPQRHGLRRGDVVTVTQIIGRRARLSDPIEGWVSLHTADGEMILRPTRGHDKYAESEAMNRKFDRLKKEQMADGVRTGPIIQALPTHKEQSKENVCEENDNQSRSAGAFTRIQFRNSDEETVDKSVEPDLLGDDFFDVSNSKLSSSAQLPRLAPPSGSTVPVLKPPPRSNPIKGSVEETKSELQNGALNAEEKSAPKVVDKICVEEKDDLLGFTADFSSTPPKEIKDESAKAETTNSFDPFADLLG